MANILISVGDYVLEQDGLIDQPKIVVWDDVSAVDVFVGISDDLYPVVFDSIVVQDPVQPNLITTVALTAFDTVRVQEGQADSDVMLISLFEDVTVTESVNITMTKLNITANDVVTVIDSPGIFAQGPLGVIGIDTVTVQEFLDRYLSLYINAFDNVLVVDGALAPDIFDTVSVAEDVTVKLGRLVISVSDAVTVTESQEIVGMAYSLVVNEDLVTSESVTVLMRNLTPAVSDDVIVSESVTVFVSTIDLTINISEDVTVVEYIETQTNPIQIDEYTQIVTDDVPFALTGLLLIATSDTVAAIDEIDIRLLPIKCSVFDDVSVNERIALRLGPGGRKKHDLTTVGAGE